jgi:hypothetical protein
MKQATQTEAKEPKKIAKRWLESLTTQGSITINDPAFA